MKDGYALATASGLGVVAGRLASREPTERNVLRDRLRVGVHRDVEVTA